MDRDDNEASEDEASGGYDDEASSSQITDENNDESDDSDNSDVEIESNSDTEVYDISLAATHSYMTGLESVSRRWILEADWVGRLPVMSHHSVVFPGETVPLLLPPTRNAVLLSQTAQAIKQDRLFGLLCPDQTGVNVAGYGVLCEVYEASVADDDEPFVAFKARAVHRFQLTAQPAPDDPVPLYEFDRMRLMELRVLPELSECGALRHARDHSLAPAAAPLMPLTHPTYPPPPPRRRPPLTEAELRHEKRQRCLRFTGRAPPRAEAEAPVAAARGARGERARAARRLEAAATPWPPFLHDLLDYERMRAHLRDYFKTIMLDKMPEDPITLSFWVASNMALSRRDRMAMFLADHALERLRMACRLTHRKSVLCCTACTTELARRDHIFPMSSEGVHANFVNPGGYVHDLLTVRHTANVSLSGVPSDEYSWFPGYSWTIAACERCQAHVGWRFAALKPSLRPLHFWGLCRNKLQPRARRRPPPPARGPAPAPVPASSSSGSSRSSSSSRSPPSSPRF